LYHEAHDVTLRYPNLKTFLGQALAILVLLATTGFGPEPFVTSPISPQEFIRAMVTDRSPVLDFYFREGLNPNARVENDQPLLLAATLRQDESTVARLLSAGASADLADDAGLTPLMVAAREGNLNLVRQFAGAVTDINATDRKGFSALHYALAQDHKEVVELLLHLSHDLGPNADGILSTALGRGDKETLEMILGRLPVFPQWTSKTRQALDAALAEGRVDQVKLLVSKHAVSPTPLGKTVPLLAYAIASNNGVQLKTMLAAGFDPNTILPANCDKDFLDMIKSRSLRSYLEDDRNVTALMLAAGLGQVEDVRLLLTAGADRNRSSGRFHMMALYLAAEQGNWQTTQVLLGGGPSPDQLRVEISLAEQKAQVWKDGVSVLTTVCSTGRQGYPTRPGDYVITDKERSHRSTIYKVDMPYFMRLSCLDFGMHEGVVPNHPASHGCIRLPGDVARRLFAEIPVGTVVSVK
jgi:ankyrin repeat protein